MIQPLRKSLFILLALLQMVAPLVHAHPEGTHPDTVGIHLPGLERLNQDHSPAANHTNFAHAELNEILISISTGINKQIIFFNPIHQDFIVQHNNLFSVTSLLLGVVSSPFNSIYKPSILPLSVGSRAPPHTSISLFI